MVGADGARSEAPLGEVGSRRQRSYALMLPPGWHRIDARDGSEAELRRIVDRAFAHSSPDQTAALRRKVESGLRDFVAEARSRGVLDLYLPLGNEEDDPFLASFAVAELAVDPGVDAMHVLLALAGSERGAKAVEIAGSVGLRTEYVRDARSMFQAALRADGDEEDPELLELSSGLEVRRVRYIVGVPGCSAQWVSVVFSTTVPCTAEGAGVGDAFVALFDAIMTSFRWR